MTEAFGNLVAPVFEEVVAFLDEVGAGRHPSLERQKQVFREVLDGVQKRAVSAPEYKPVLYPLVYWIDEVLTNSAWAHAGEWRNAILEFHYFGTRNAFDDFWARAGGAEGSARDRERNCKATNRPFLGDDLLETYFLCVALGFLGSHYLDPQGLHAWVERVRPLILPGPPAVEHSHAGGEDWGLRPLPGDWLLVAGSWLLSASILLALIGFIATVHEGR